MSDKDSTCDKVLQDGKKGFGSSDGVTSNRRQRLLSLSIPHFGTEIAGFENSFLQQFFLLLAMPWFGIDIGGTLVKLVYFEPQDHHDFVESEDEILRRKKIQRYLVASKTYGGTGVRDDHLRLCNVEINGRVGTIHFIRFPTDRMLDFVHLVKIKGFAEMSSTVCATGGGSLKYAAEASVNISLFGKVCCKKDLDNARIEDLAHSALVTTTNNIGSIAFNGAKTCGIDRIVFVGNFLRVNPIAARLLSNAMNFWSRGTKKALFLIHEGYFGAVGCLDKLVDVTETRRRMRAENSEHRNSGIKISNRSDLRNK
ncbi:unnamed protein product [Thelazia callipaeda]|uniref:Pantothenate kinase n=1 Tax=Thelazia callipaeda TaxID=103827 RepID=A0A0N5CVT4_THECL|nr:unnamed protein product [Thelazia callipaeda]